MHEQSTSNHFGVRKGSHTQKGIVVSMWQVRDNQAVPGRRKVIWEKLGYEEASWRNSTAW
jgi:hypothetical protein